MKIIAIRIGDRYGPEYETYLEEKLSDYEIEWVRSPIQENVQMQWNKIYAMTLDIDEPVCVMDIDMLLINDYKKVFDYPVEKGQFLTIKGWWRDTSNSRFTINGGFYKYYPTDCKYIYDKFMEQPEYYQRKYIEEGYTSGPINGEQHFIEDSVNERLELIYLPSSWVCRMEGRDKKRARHTQSQLNAMYRKETGNPYMFLGDAFHDDIKLVHFTHMDNHPHRWEKYNLFVEKLTSDV